MEYERKVGGPLADGSSRPGADVQLERVMAFGTVTIISSDPKTGGAREANVAEMLLVRGLASLVRHRRCAPLSCTKMAAGLYCSIHISTSQ